MLQAILLHFLWLTSIYGYSLSPIDGGTSVSFSNFSGKKILIVNTASGSPFASQYAALEQLAVQYKDSLVVIAIPSNDFSNEPESDSIINATVRTTYGVDFLLAAKTSISGSGQSGLYQWLTSVSLNGTINHPVTGDFQKYLVGSDGQLIAWFASVVDPMGPEIKNSLQGQ